MLSFNKPVTFSIILSLLALLPLAAMAQDVHLAWDPSESEGVVGYKIYYKADSPELPLDGIEALEGPSPIDVGNVTSFVLHEFPEGSVYYFRATAYDESGHESTLSNLAASAWIPTPISPANGENVGFSETLVWSAPPTDLDLTFNLTCTTEGAPHQAAIPPFKTPKAPPTTTLVVSIFLALLGFVAYQALFQRHKKVWGFTAIAFALCLPLASCGGGGGGGSDPSSSPSSPKGHTIKVDGLADSYYTVSDLEGGKTYYWYVTAVDNEGREYQSDTWSFVAL